MKRPKPLARRAGYTRGRHFGEGGKAKLKCKS